jgi:RNA polymerase sigma-70 factor (ECF subfamily)
MAVGVDVQLTMASEISATPAVERSGEPGFVEALRAGDKAARRLLVQRHHGRVRSVLYRLLGDDPEIADLAQEVFVQAFTSLHRFRGDERALKPWMVRVAVFTARAAMRRRKSWRRLFTPSAEADSTEGRPAASPEVREELQAVYAVFDKLPTDERVVLALHMMDQMSLLEIADAVQVSRSTVIRRLEKARERFTLLIERDPVLRESLLGKGGS